MKETLRMIAILKRLAPENGVEHFEGSLDATLLRKASRRDVEIVLMPVDQLPASLRALLGEGRPAPDDLLVFACIGENDKGGRPRKQG